jgi:hypothetical protein
VAPVKADVAPIRSLNAFATLYYLFFISSIIHAPHLLVIVSQQRFGVLLSASEAHRELNRVPLGWGTLVSPRGRSF